MANNNSNRKNVYEIYKTMEYGPVLDSASLGETWLKGRKFGPFIDGSWIQESGDGTEIHNPCTGHHIATMVNSSQGDVDRAVASSVTAFLSWRQLSGYDRAKYLYSLARHLQKNVSLLVQVESLNRGVQTSDPREFDVPAAVRHFYHYAGWAQLVHSDLEGWEPRGVVAGILSSCCPLAMLAWIIAPALAAGNTVCLRPSKQTPLPAMLLAHIAIEAGLPAGVLNVLPGGSDVAQQLLLHNDVAHITFSGPTSIGRQIIQATAGCPKKLTLLLSGRTPMLVFDTADIDSASDSVVKNAWFNQGQVPWAVTQLLVQESIFKDFTEKLKKRLNKVAIGGAFNKMADIGPPCSSQTVVNVRQAITKAVEKGLEVFQVKVPDHLSQDLFFPPTLVFGGQLESNQVVGEDIIAPVVTVTPFRTAKEAIALANNTRYGVAASVWTESTALALEVAAHLEVGTIWINSHGVFDAAVPFGGWKQSGLGYFSGKTGLLEYLQREGTPQFTKLATPLDYTQFGNSADTSASVPSSLTPIQMSASPIVDCTYKLYYGGMHKRPDGNTSRTVYNARNQPLALVPEGGKKDVRNAVEAAVKAQPAWWRGGAHLRAQIIYNMAEKLQARRLDFIRHLQTVWNCDTQSADFEVERSLQLLFYWAASCDKPSLGGDNRDMSAMVFQEPLGVMALLVCEGATGLGLESLLRLVVPAVSNGNTVVVVPDPEHPTISLELCQVMDTCDLPSGVVNVLTGDLNILSSALVSHQEVRGVWYSEGSPELGSYLRWGSAHNLKRVWQVPSGQLCRELAEYHATQTKAVWVPGGQIFAN